jgi:hypothetical protein
MANNKKLTTKKLLDAVFSVIRVAAVVRQRYGNHVYAALDQHSTMEELLEALFSARSVRKGYR